ncbi:acetylglutamate kinase [Prevotella sp. CAG:5226]|nr:acetylglutamate kinase [Prevotella sp. CAG:5226]
MCFIFACGGCIDYLCSMKQHLTIVKVGGKIVETPDTLNQLLQRFSALEGPKVLVHGGGRTATDVAAQLGVETHMVDGRRITDAEMLRVVTMVYGGLVNKNVVAKLQACGVNALGLTGADMNVIRSHRRPLKNGIDYGYVGDVDKVDADRLQLLIDAGITPVMAPLTHNGEGDLLNTNADTIAAETAKALAQHYEVTLVYCFEHAGVLADANDEASVIRRITPQTFEQLKADGIVSGGMLPKIENSLMAVRAGVKRVVITSADKIGTNEGTSIE